MESVLKEPIPIGADDGREESLPNEPSEVSVPARRARLRKCAIHYPGDQVTVHRSIDEVALQPLDRCGIQLIILVGYVESVEDCLGKISPEGYP